MTVGKQSASRFAVERGVGFIYVAEFTDRPVIKIGFSLAPERRMKTLFRKKTAPGRLLATMPGRIADERAIHRALGGHAAPENAPFSCSPECYPRSILAHPAIPAALTASLFFACRAAAGTHSTASNERATGLRRLRDQVVAGDAA